MLSEFTNFIEFMHLRFFIILISHFSRPELTKIPSAFYDGIFGYLQKQIKNATLVKIDMPSALKV
jgi:hypothetical protein